MSAKVSIEFYHLKRIMPMIAFDCSLQQNLSDHVNPIKEGEVVFKHHSFPKKLSQKGLHMDGIMHFQAISVHDGHM